MSIIGLIVGYVVGALWVTIPYYLERKALIQKADASRRLGQSNIEFVLGVPLAIMHEADYVRLKQLELKNRP